MNENGTLETLLQEKGEMRQEIMMLQRSQMQLIPAMLMIIGAFAGVYWGGNIISNPKVQSGILFFLSQVEVFLVFAWLLLLSNISCHSRHLARIEELIENEIPTPIELWESGPSRTLLWNPVGSFMIVLYYMFLLCTAFVAFLIYAASKQIGRPLCISILVLEAIALLVPLCLIVKAGQRRRDASNEPNSTPAGTRQPLDEVPKSSA